MKQFHFPCKRIFALLTAVLLFVTATAIPIPAKADTVNVLTISHVNPLYADIADEQPLLYAVEPLAAQATTYHNLENAGILLRDAMETRASTVVVGYAVNGTAHTNDQIKQYAKDILNEAVKHTGEPTQGDYLLWHYKGYTGNISWTADANKTYITYTYQLSYLSTAQQEQVMDEAVDGLLDTLDVYYASDYKKVRAVYDYICENITYDYAGLAAESDLAHTAYAALVNNTAVCQGYASLLYRLLLTLDVDTRLIAGNAAGGRHGWNIVELSDEYYNVDSTWDAGRTTYGYFLKAEENFGDHSRFDEYNTAQFHAAYPMSSDDYDIEAAESGMLTGQCTWSLNGTVLTISGNGAMADYDYFNKERPWGNQITEVIFEEGVTAVGTYAFLDCDALTHISFPQSLTSIGALAFYDCDALQTVTIPTTVTAIGTNAFNKCRSLTAITVAEGHAQYCDIDGVLFDAAKTTLLQYPAAKADTAYTTPNTVKTIDGFAFSYCVNLKNVVIGDSVKTVGEHAFVYCDVLQTATIGNGVTDMQIRTFYECPALQTVVIGNDVPVIPEAAFYGCTSLSSVTLGVSVTAIGEKAFYDCTSLLDMQIPNNVQTIGAYAFRGCSALTSVWLGKNVTSIGRYAFFACNALQDVWYANADSTVLTIDNEFGGNNSLIYATWHYADPPKQNGWVKDGGKWYFYENSVMVKNAWRKDSKGWVYLGSDGAMVTNKWVKDSKGWCYVGENGYAVTNCWKKDSYGWIYLDANGSMTKAKWVKTNNKWYYLDANGYMLTNKWQKDSKGWVYVGSDGAMVTNKWVKDSKGWCYVGADGYAVTNTWKKDSKGWIYLDANGSMTKSKWVKDKGNWYYCDANGYMVANKSMKIGNKTYHFNASGVCTNP